MPLAAARAGLIHVPINPVLRRAQVAHILADSGARMLVCAPERVAALQKLKAAAVRHGADLLVIGRGVSQGALGRLRSNAHALIRHSPCAVLSV